MASSIIGADGPVIMIIVVGRPHTGHFRQHKNLVREGCLVSTRRT